MPPVLLSALFLLACGRPETRADGAEKPAPREPGEYATPAAADEAGGGQGVLAIEAEPVDAAAFLQAGSWADQVESVATEDACDVEDVDIVGDLMDSGAFTLALTGDSTFTLVFEQEASADDDDEFGAISPTAWTCTRSAADAATFTCDGASWSADYASGNQQTTVTFTATLSGSFARSTALTLNPVVKVTCEGPSCADPALGMTPPCSLSVRRVAVYTGF